eukprot:GDKI01033271.1.p1 GENE.GDKI01033271.1~~GDKI01033271.1.p1  ORF type:complete len:423 (-),score=64.36 GDKI01033271.1:20-1288(-)
MHWVSKTATFFVVIFLLNVHLTEELSVREPVYNEVTTQPPTVAGDLDSKENEEPQEAKKPFDSSNTILLNANDSEVPIIRYIMNLQKSYRFLQVQWGGEGGLDYFGVVDFLKEVIKIKRKDLPNSPSLTIIIDLAGQVLLNCPLQALNNMVKRACDHGDDKVESQNMKMFGGWRRGKREEAKIQLVAAGPFSRQCWEKYIQEAYGKESKWHIGWNPDVDVRGGVDSDLGGFDNSEMLIPIVSRKWPVGNAPIPKYTLTKYINELPDNALLRFTHLPHKNQTHTTQFLEMANYIHPGKLLYTKHIGKHAPPKPHPDPIYPEEQTQPPDRDAGEEETDQEGDTETVNTVWWKRKQTVVVIAALFIMCFIAGAIRYANGTLPFSFRGGRLGDGEEDSLTYYTITAVTDSRGAAAARSRLLNNNRA